MTVYMYIATVAWLSMLAGFVNRRHRARHVPLVLSAIGLDIALVLYLQITRQAIQTAVSFTLEILQQLHIAVSTMALLLYFPILYLGFELLRGRASARQRLLHRRLAITALSLRTLGFFFMFSMIE